MKFTTNYKRTADATGLTTAQNVTIECTELELGYINYRIRKELEKQGKPECYKRLREGTNVVEVDMMQGLTATEMCNKDKRIKGDRTTRINVVLTQRKKVNRDGECVTCEHATPDMKYCTLHNIAIYQDDMGCGQWGKA